MLSMKSYDEAYVNKVRDRISAVLHLLPDDPRALNEIIVALDASFVHRMRGQEGKDGNPLNEVRMLANSIMTSGAILAADPTIKYDPTKSVTGQNVGEPIALDRQAIGRLLTAVIVEIRKRFA